MIILFIKLYNITNSNDVCTLDEIIQFVGSRISIIIKKC